MRNLVFAEKMPKILLMNKINRFGGITFIDKMINCNTQGMLENSSIIQYGLPIILLGLLACGLIYLFIRIYNQHSELKLKKRQ